MGVNSLPKTVTRQRRDCDLNPGSSAPEFSTLTTRATEPPELWSYTHNIKMNGQELEWKQTNGWTDTTDRITFHAEVVGK